MNHYRITSFLVSLSLTIAIQPRLIAQQTSPTNLSLSKKLISSLDIGFGPNHSWFHGDKYLSDRVKNFNYTIAAGLNHCINSRFDIKLQFLIENKGGKNDRSYILYDEPNDPNIYHNYRSIVDTNLNYSTLSITTGYKLDKARNLVIGLGPYLSYLNKLVSKTEIFKEVNLISTNYSYEMKDYRRFDGGLSLYFSYKLNIYKNIKLNIQPLTNIGLLNIRNHNLPATPLKNNSFTVLLGVNLN
jgi:hypothetical protein